MLLLMVQLDSVAVEPLLMYRPPPILAELPLIVQLVEFRGAENEHAAAVLGGVAADRAVGQRDLAAIAVQSAAIAGGRAPGRS